MIKSVLSKQATGEALLTHPGANGPILLNITPGMCTGRFKSSTRSSAGTTTVTSPDQGGSIILTDLIISTDKVNGATITVQFTDGTNTVSIFDGVATDAPINLALSFGGRWQGWRDARIDMVTAGALNATVAIGYYKYKDSLVYAEWDSLR